MSFLPPDPRYRVIVNPTAGRGRGARLLPYLHTLLQGLRYELVQTEAPRQATALAAAAAEEGYEVVVAVGGDGTTFEVINGLAGRDTALAVLPIGSGNDFIKPLGIPTDLPAAVACLRRGRVRRIDLGHVGQTYFGNMLGIGFDARVAVETYRLPHLHGFALYLAALWKTVWRYRSPYLHLEGDARSFEGRFLLVAVGNGRCQGANFWLTPEAEMDDGYLDLCLISDMPLPLFFYHLPKVFRGKHTRLREVRMLRARRIRVRSAEPVAVHADGEVLAEAATEVEVEIRPAALRVVC
ncbi:MAG: diacylglycerol/lipid kinase family protein [Chloroflexia bacterium]